MKLKSDINKKCQFPLRSARNIKYFLRTPVAPKHEKHCKVRLVFKAKIPSRFYNI